MLKAYEVKDTAKLCFSSDAMDKALARLNEAVAQRRSVKHCLRLWSTFVRVRDGFRCVDCHVTKRTAAHHICRKSFLPQAAFQTGNGITLCDDCHHATHAGFNARADLALPMDAQGGEKIDMMERLYCILGQDARDRGILRDDYYYLSDDVLARFKLFQGFHPETAFPGVRLEQASLIWSQCPQHILTALLQANGFDFSD